MSSMTPLLAHFTAPIAVICLWAVAAAGSIDVATMVNDLQLQDSSALEILAKEGIDNNSLPLLTNEELEKLPGISRGARLRIVDYIQKHRQEAQQQQDKSGDSEVAHVLQSLGLQGPSKFHGTPDCNESAALLRCTATVWIFIVSLRVLPKN